VQEVTSDLDDLVKKNLRLSGRQVDIITLAGRVCKKHGISLGELRSGSRRREIVEARGIVSWIAVREFRVLRGRCCSVSRSHEFMHYEIGIIRRKTRHERLC